MGNSFFKNLVEVFNLEILTLITQLKKSYQAGDFEAVKNHGHKLKGMSMNLGAVYLSRLGEEIEESRPETLQRAVGQLDDAYDKTQQVLAGMVKESI